MGLSPYRLAKVTAPCRDTMRFVDDKPCQLTILVKLGDDGLHRIVLMQAFGCDVKQLRFPSTPPESRKCRLRVFTRSDAHCINTFPLQPINLVLDEGD